MFTSESGRKARQRKAGLHRARQFMQQPQWRSILDDMRSLGHQAKAAKAAELRRSFSDSLCSRSNCDCGVHQAYVEGTLTRPRSKRR